MCGYFIRSGGDVRNWNFQSVGMLSLGSWNLRIFLFPPHLQGTESGMKDFCPRTLTPFIFLIFSGM